MNPDQAPQPQPLSAEELALRQKNVRKWILLRGLFLGILLAAWWILFAPDSLVEPPLKYILGVLAGFVATGSYLFNLRANLFPKPPAVARQKPEPVEPRPGPTE